jgi:hypothetical protein
VRAWLSESWADSTLRWKFLDALSARGLADAAEIAALAAADPARGETAAATCLARRPDPIFKAAAWAAAAARGWRMAVAHAEGVWVPGQEALLRELRDRYFSEALPMLISLSGTGPSTPSRRDGWRRCCSRSRWPRTRR